MRALVTFVYIFLYTPIVLIVLTSFKTRADALASPPIWRFSPTTENYRHVFSEYDLGHYFQNSVIVATCSSVPTSSSAYVLARQMGGDAPLLAQIITLQTILAAITMPIAIAWVS